MRLASLLVPVLLFALTGGGCSKAPGSSDTVSGTIETDEARVASRHGGRVVEVLAMEGQSLQAGQMIARLEAPELAPRRDQVSAMLAELKAGARREELAAAKADAEALAAELDWAALEERRAKELFENGTISPTERDRAAARVASLTKSVAAATNRHALLAAGARPERIAQVEAQLAEIETQARELAVTASAASVLEVLHIKPGDVLNPNQPVATLLLTNHLWVRVYVPEPWLGHLRLGAAVRARVDSFPGRDFPGEIEQIARAAEFTPRNVQTVDDRVKQVFGVKVRLSGDSGELRAGMAADVFFPGLPEKSR